MTLGVEELLVLGTTIAVYSLVRGKVTLSNKVHPVKGLLSGDAHLLVMK